MPLEWNDTASWSASSGGSGGASVPGSDDVAVFDANSVGATSNYINIREEILCHFDWSNLTPDKLCLSVLSGGILSLQEDIVNVSYVNVTNGGILTTNNYDITINGLTDYPYNGTFNLGTSTITVATDFNVSYDSYYLNKFHGDNATIIMNADSNGLHIGSNNATIKVKKIQIITTSSIITIVRGHLDVEEIVISGDGTIVFYDGTNDLTVSGNVLVSGSTPGGLYLLGYSSGVWNIIKSSGNVFAYNCKLKNSQATGGASFFAPVNDCNVDDGGNTGWSFAEYYHLDEMASVQTLMDTPMDIISVNASVSDNIDALMESMNESISTQDSIIPQWTANGALPEEITALNEMTGIYSITINESLGIADEEPTYILTIPKTIDESIVLDDYSNASFHFHITDVLLVWDVLQHGWNVTNDESLVLTDSLAEVLGLMISDWITLVDSQSNNWNGADIVNDALNIYDIAEKYLKIADTIDESIVLTDTNNYVLTVAVLEYLGFTSLASAMRTTAATVSESLALTEAQSYAWAELIAETLSVVDVATVIQTFVDVVSESIALADSNSLINRLGLSLNESLVFTETVTSKGTLYNAVYDTLRMNVTVEMAGEVYECYVLNTPKFMPSMYSGFDFNSYCVFENRAFGANDTGIYELTGETDSGSTIHDGVILSSTDFGSRNQKKFRRAYLGISGSSPVMVVETEEGERRVYNIDTDGKTVISHELKSRKWKLSVADFDELDTVKLIPVILSK